MTDTLDMEELKRLAAEATPGPWRYDEQDGRKNQRFICFEEIVTDYSPTKLLATVSGTAWKPGRSAVPNARLIVAAVNSLPALIAIAEEVERLRVELRHHNMYTPRTAEEIASHD